MPYESEGRFSKALHARMDELNLSIRAVSRATHVSYEHVRRLVGGETLPSEFMCQKLAKALGLNEEELNKLAVADRIEGKYGETAAVLGGRDPESAPVMKRWKQLTAEQKKMVTAMMDGFLSQNEASKPHRRRA